jgi:heat shock protein beta
MSKDELARNLGTIARSGTSEFLKRAEEGGGADGNLIGQFGAYAPQGIPRPC